jgi:hypothetical protein
MIERTACATPGLDYSGDEEDFQETLASSTHREIHHRPERASSGHQSMFKLQVRSAKLREDSICRKFLPEPLKVR